MRSLIFASFVFASFCSAFVFAENGDKTSADDPSQVDSPGDFTSADAIAAKSRYLAALQKAQNVYSEAIAPAAKKYSVDLNEAITKATQRGDLEEALKIRKAKQEIDNQTSGGELAASAFIGSWHILSNREDEGIWVFSGSGVRAKGKTVKGTPFRLGNFIVVKWQGGWTNRLHIESGRLFMEGWNPEHAKLLNRAPDYFGYGDPAK